jgi:hypothetical protein
VAIDRRLAQRGRPRPWTFRDQMSGSVCLQDIAVLDGTLVVFG